MHVHANNDKLHTGSSLKGWAALTYVEDWHSRRGGHSEGGGGERGGAPESRCLSLRLVLEERKDANEDKRSLWNRACN